MIRQTLTSVAVRELVEFTAKRGDLDSRFTPAPSAQEGIEGHVAVTTQRGADYRREVRLESTYRDIRIRGRADGLQPAPMLLEEVKTFRGDLSRMPANRRDLHWAQLKIYGAMLCAERSLPQIELGLVYYDVDKQRETRIRAHFTATDLATFFETHSQVYWEWDRQQRAHKDRRDAALSVVAFPHPEFHSGQRTLAEAVYRSARRRQGLMIQAPTGIGKSIGTLYPMLKAMARQSIDKIFYLSAKTSGRRMALEALASLPMEGGELPLRVLELIARDKACVHPDKVCQPDSCPLAKGFYDRLPAARAAAVTTYRLDQASVREHAAAHQVCPYYLSQDLVRWCDVVVGDYNYWFDQTALLYGLTLVNQWKVAVLVDEAHNLVERGRAMYSAELHLWQLAPIRAVAPTKIKKQLMNLQRVWTGFIEQQTGKYQTYAVPPALLIDTLQGLTSAMGKYFNDHPSAIVPPLQAFYFDALNFLGLAEQLDGHALFDCTHHSQGFGPKQRQSTLCVRNVSPARYLAPRIAAGITIAFSATLNPPHYFRDLLGFKSSTAWLDVPSPFSSEQLQVHVIRRISTRYADRAHSIEPIAKLVARQFSECPGNYLVFLSSHLYLGQLADHLAVEHPDLPIVVQSPTMSESQRAAFLDRFAAGTCIIGLAVLGGVFAEGIDLPGDRLIGSFVATLGLPQSNAVNEAILSRMAALFGPMAYDYTYLYPGIQKVVQATGRVIRSAQDRGTAFLIDDRFGQRRVARLLPRWWSIRDPDAPVPTPAVLRSELNQQPMHRS